MSNKPTQEEIDLVESGHAISYAEARRITHKKEAQNNWLEKVHNRMVREAIQMIEYIPTSRLKEELTIREAKIEKDS